MKGRIAAIIEMAEDGDLEGLEEALRNTPESVNKREEHGWTPLHRAAIFGYSEIVALLLRLGANADAADKKQFTPLHNASMGTFEHIPCMQMLVAAGASVEAKNAYGQTPLIVAAQYSNSYAVAFLLGAGASANARDGRGRTALDEARHQAGCLNPRGRSIQHRELKAIIEILGSSQSDV